MKRFFCDSIFEKKILFQGFNDWQEALDRMDGFK